MAHSRSALKRWRQNERRRVRNKAVRSLTRTSVKKAVVATEGGAEDTGGTVREAVSALDRAAKKGVIHANNAARNKSRLMTKLNAAAGGQAVAAEKKAPAKKKAASGAKKTPAAKKTAARPKTTKTTRTRTAKS